MNREKNPHTDKAKDKHIPFTFAIAIAIAVGMLRSYLSILSW